MPINPNIALGVQPMQIQNQMNQLAQYAQIQQGQQANQLGQMQMEEYKRAREEENQVRNYLAQGNDLNSPEAQRALLGMGKTGMGLLTNLQAQQKIRVEQAKALQEVAGKSLGGIIASPDINTAVTRVTEFGKITGTDVTPYLKELQQIGNNPEGIKQWAASHWQDVKDLLPKLGTMDTGGQIVPYAQNPLTGAVTQASGGVKKVITPGESARLAQDRAQFQVTQNAPVFNAEAGGWVTKPLNGVSGVIPVEGMQPKIPASVEKEMVGINQQKSIVQGAIDAVNATPSAFSLGRGLAGNLPLGETLAGRKEAPEQTQARAYVFNNVSKVINERAGAAQSAQELQRLKSFLPADTDNAKQINNKLKAFQTYLDDLEKGTTSKRVPSTPVSSGPKVGEVQDGYVFKGGNPADAKSWEKK